MKVKWTPPAEVALDAYLARLHGERSALSAQARTEIMQAVDRLSTRPFIGRPARWSGLREWSVLRWRKIVVYRVDAEQIVIVAFYDARQNFSAVKPEDAE